MPSRAALNSGMTSSRLLAEAKSALAALRNTDLPPHEWRAVTE
jgi:hypothetical protein